MVLAIIGKSKADVAGGKCFEGSSMWKREAEGAGGDPSIRWEEGWIGWRFAGCMDCFEVLLVLEKGRT